MLHRFLAHPRAALGPAPAATAAVMLAAALSTGLLVAFANTEAYVARSFTTALEAASGATRAPSGALVAGSEEYWLRRAGRDSSVGARLEPAAWTASAAALGVSVGDRITIASGGRDRVLEIIAIAEVPASVTRIDMGPPQGTSGAGEASPDELLVTCRETSSEAGGGLIRFMIGAGGGPARAQAAKPPRAL